MRHLAPPTSSRSLVLAAGILFSLAVPSHGSALPIGGGAGVDRQSGPGGQDYTAGLLFGTASVGIADLTLAAIRYDDSQTGYGNALFANAGHLVPGFAKVRAIGSRSFGDSGYRAWKLRAGPEWSVHLLTLGAYGLHQEDNAGATLNAVGAEIGTSIVPTLSTQVGGMVGRRDGSANSSQASCGVVWSAFSHVQVIGELDMGRGVTSSSSSTSGGGPLQHLSATALGTGGGTGDKTTTQSSIETVGLLGVRFTIP
jgi:hypothetical protein